MSSYQRGTKRAAESAPSGPKFKSAKPAHGGKTWNNDKGDDRSYKKPYNKDGGKSFNKPSYNKGGQGNDFRGSSGNKGKGPAKWDHTHKPTASREEPAQKRKRPVTQGGGEEDVNDDDAMSVDGEGDGYEVVPVDKVEEEKRGKMSKEERAALHAAQPHRKTLLPSHVLLTETLLPLWEQARRLEMPKEERVKAITELWAAVQGHVLEISRGHKGGRILQTVSAPIA